MRSCHSQQCKFFNNLIIISRINPKLFFIYQKKIHQIVNLSKDIQQLIFTKKQNNQQRRQLPFIIVMFMILILLQMFNGLQSPTFGSSKAHKEPPIYKIQTNGTNKNEFIPKSFKQIKELKQNNLPKYACQVLNKKTFKNHENKFSHVLFDKNARKDLINIDEQIKTFSGLKSVKFPSDKTFETLQIALKSKILQNSHYHSRINVPKSAQNPNLMTPYICKTNRSYLNNQNHRNHTIFNEKHKKEQSSITESMSISSKTSFEGGLSNFSYEKDSFTIYDKSSSVTSSVQFLVQPPILSQNDFDLSKINCNSMKKSMQIELSTKDSIKVISNSRLSNVSSISFTEKFKHYKKRPRKENAERNLRLEQFKIIEQIGSGKYGKVFLAKHQQTGCLYALKSVAKQLIRQENLQIPFLRQIKIQMFLSHPNIVKLYGFFQDVDNIYLIMEYCSGSNLHKLICENQQFQCKQIIQILGNVFEAVSFLHCNGIIHRDIKPENIVIQNGVYKLCDFGWAAYTCGDNRKTFCGSPLYVCPEVLKGQQYNSKVDIWGLGIIAYELTFGHVPFQIINQTDLSKIVKDPVYFPILNSSSQMFTPIIERMLDKNPYQRPSLDEILSNEDFRKFNQNLKSPLYYQLGKLF